MTESPQTLAEALRDFRRRYVLQALERHRGNVTRASRELGIRRCETPLASPSPPLPWLAPTPLNPI